MGEKYSTFGLRQPVNQWLCFAIIGLLAFWVVLYYLVHRSEAFGEIYILDVTTYAAEKSL